MAACVAEEVKSKDAHPGNSELLHQILQDITKEPSSLHVLETEISVLYGQSSYLHIAEHFEPTGVLAWRVLMTNARFQRERDGFCWGGGASVLHCLNWQVLTAAFLSYLRCDMASSDIALTGRCDEKQRNTTPARVVLCYTKTLVWILQEGLWNGDPWLQDIPASCFPLCMAHLIF